MADAQRPTIRTRHARLGSHAGAAQPRHHRPPRHSVRTLLTWPYPAPACRLRARWASRGTLRPSSTRRHRLKCPVACAPLTGIAATGSPCPWRRQRRGRQEARFSVAGVVVLYRRHRPTLFPKEKGSCLGSFWRISLAPVARTPAPKPQGVKYELHTLPVDAKAVTDGDTITVYVDTADHPESCNVPQEVFRAAVERAKSWAAKNYRRADALQKIILHAGYRQVPNLRGEQVLAKRYQIRLRGIDAPENSMPYGKEAKEELVKLVQGKSLKISIYDNDRYGRLVGDVDCKGVFVQEHMLKKGLAWYYTAYDQRLELAEWENQALVSRMGLWALPNPDKPWQWRKEKRIGTT